MNFALHPQLEHDTLPVGELPLCRVLMMDQALLPWFILVPRQSGLREIHELSAADRQQLMAESCALAQAMAAAFAPCKLNIAALGNMVEQLHVHHVGRYRDDPAWPHPVWGRLPAQRCDTALATQRRATLRESMAALDWTLDWTLS